MAMPQILLHSRSPSPTPAWRILEFVDGRGQGAISPLDRGRLTSKGRAKFDRTLDHLRWQPTDRWIRPKAASIGDHIYVIHFTDENRIPWRISGFIDLPHHAFIMCVPGTERDGNYEPPNYIEQVRACRRIVMAAGDFYLHTRAWKRF